MLKRGLGSTLMAPRLLKFPQGPVAKLAFSTCAIARQELKAVIVKKIPPKKSRSAFKSALLYLWRATYLSALLGVGYVGYSIYNEMNPGQQKPQTDFTALGAKKKTLVILGTGWGAISLLKNMNTELYNVVVISPRNYFLFTPLLPSVPTGTIDLKSIIDPVRNIAKQRPSEVKYFELELTHIDPKKKEVTVTHSSNPAIPGLDSVVNEKISRVVPYDYLVVSVGAQVNTFNTPGVKENALFLKELPDLVQIRSKLMQNLELLQLLPKGSPERRRLLTFTVIGGGPTGVELAAEVKDYIDDDLSKWFPGISQEVNIQLIELLPNILNSFNKKLILYSEYVFQKINIDLRVNTMVKSVDEHNITASVKKPNGESEEITIPYGTLVWATGNGVRPLIHDLAELIGEEQKQARRGLLLNSFLKVNGTTDIFALGDCTFTKNPPTAQVANQQGIYLAGLLDTLAKIEDLEYSISQLSPDNQPSSTPESVAANEDKLSRLEKKLTRAKQNLQPFKYSHMGALAYIGSERAVADLVWGDWSSISTGGSLTFLFWRTAYVAMTLSVKNKVLICLDWLKVGIFGRDCSKE